MKSMKAPIQKDNNSNLFCFFNGYTKGMVDVIDVKIDPKLKIYQFFLSLPTENMCKGSHYVQLDGVLGEVVSNSHPFLTVATTFELIEHTSLKNISKGKQISLGLLAEVEPKEAQDFLIHPSASSTATVENISILPGHRYTLKIDMVCDRNQIVLEEEKHVGFSGSSLLVRELKQIEGLYRFSIYAGKQTQENTCFKKNALKIGDVINMTAPKTDVPSEVPYPYELQSLKPKN